MTQHIPLALLILCVACGDDSTADVGVRDGGVVDGSGEADALLVDASRPDASPDASRDAGADVSIDAADLCSGVDCGFGSCTADSGAAACECDAGYHAEGLFCRADPCEGEDCPMSVEAWQELFDAEFNSPRRDAEDCEALSTSTGSEQEHYFFAYCIDGLVSMWRATGDNDYLDTSLRLIENTVDDAVLRGDGFRYWPGPNDGSTHPLWDSYYWRQVTHLLRVMHGHPELLAMNDYQARYEALLEFSTRDIWDKWESDGLGNLYRSRTHMASHWARIGMDLFLITGEERYRVVFDNISHGTMPNYPSNLREHFIDNPEVPGAFTWSQVWGDAPSESIQDTSHAGAIVSFINEAAGQEVYWTSADVDALIQTLLVVVWDPALGGAYHQNVDGTDTTSGAFTGPYGLPGRLGGRLHEWLHLGRHSAEIQERMETFYLDPARRNVIFFGYQAFGIGALNARILADGAPVY